MTDLGPLNYFLGISVTRNTSKMFLSQSKYATEVLERANMLNCNPCRTPVDTDSKLAADGALVSDPTMYRSLAGALQYLTFTRPDISYVVQQVFLFMHDPREPHFSALKRILRYVRGTLDYGLQLYFSSTSSLVAYSDADWAGCLLHAALLQVIVCFLATIFSLGLLSASLHCLDPVLKLSIGELQMPWLRLVGYAIFCVSFIHPFRLLRLFTVIM